MSDLSGTAVTAPGDFLSRAELHGGLPARRSSILLFAIEGRTAWLVDRSRRAMAPGVTDRSAEARERTFLETVAEGGELPIRPTIQDLERYAPAWAPLVLPHPWSVDGERQDAYPSLDPDQDPLNRGGQLLARLRFEPRGDALHVGTPPRDVTIEEAARSPAE
jgi:hypothetical protein